MKHKNEGYTLLELMISIALSIILISAFIHFFTLLQNINKKIEGYSRIQENARTLHYLLQDMITKSGSIGCNRMSNEIGLRIDKRIDTYRIGILPFQGLMNKPDIRVFSKRFKEDSDVLWVTYTGKMYPLIKHHNEYWVAGRVKWKKNKVVVLSDCRHAEFVLLDEDSEPMQSTMTRVQKNVPQNVYWNRAESAVISKFHSVLVYAGQTKRYNSMGNSIDALYTTDLNGKTHERVEGVEKIIVEYGVMQRNEIVFLKDKLVRSEQKIVAIRFHALLNSIEPYQSGIGRTLLRKWWVWEWKLNA